jgi:hypothetical protein
MQVVITVEDSALPQMTRVVAAARAAGLLDVKILESVGVITGRLTDASQLDRLRSVDGVASVEAQRNDIGIPDPGSRIQ